MDFPFPPPALMHRVSGLTSDADFAKHGHDIFTALEQGSPVPLFSFNSILDFGIGCGRVARMFREFKGRYCGIDVDGELIEWISTALPWVDARLSRPKEQLPCEDAAFDCVICVSVFTHMNEADSRFYLQELHRVTRPGASLLVSVHGRRAIKRAVSEKTIADMLAIPTEDMRSGNVALSSDGFHFTKQNGHLTKDNYEYGITFVSEQWIRSEWGKLFAVERIAMAAIHDFQDIVVMRRYP
jgi:SAM-dependent methyltransferase